MKSIEYTKKPSGPMLRAAIRKALAAGETCVQLTWGENQITIERGPWGFMGHGWIGRHGGQDIANELQKARQGLADHLHRTAREQQGGKV